MLGRKRKSECDITPQPPTKVLLVGNKTPLAACIQSQRANGCYIDDFALSITKETVSSRKRKAEDCCPCYRKDNISGCNNFQEHKVDSSTQLNHTSKRICSGINTEKMKLQVI